MALSGEEFGKALYEALGMDEKLPKENKEETLEGWKKLGKAIVKYLQENMDVTIPSGKVITNVTGQAVGVSNTTPIECEVE